MISSISHLLLIRYLVGFIRSLGDLSACSGLSTRFCLMRILSLVTGLMLYGDLLAGVANSFDDSLFIESVSFLLTLLTRLSPPVELVV